MIKGKKLLLAISVLIVIFAIGYGVLMVSEFVTYKSTDIKEYNKKAIIENFGNDLDSNLSIFPDESLENAEVISFVADFKQGILDTDGTLVLECRYNRDQFQKEINRLSSLEMTIKNESELYVNKIQYDEESYCFPAYVANAGFGHTYEYALINEKELKIVYLYLAYPNPKKFEYPEYLKTDTSEYLKDNTLDAFTMYNHSFDGGDSFTEFDD